MCSSHEIYDYIKGSKASILALNNLTVVSGDSNLYANAIFRNLPWIYKIILNHISSCWSQSRSICTSNLVHRWRNGLRTLVQPVRKLNKPFLVITLYNLFFPIKCSRKEITKKLVSSGSEYFRAFGGFLKKNLSKKEQISNIGPLSKF